MIRVGIAFVLIAAMVAIRYLLVKDTRRSLEDYVDRPVEEDWPW